MVEDSLSRIQREIREVREREREFREGHFRVNSEAAVQVTRQNGYAPSTPPQQMLNRDTPVPSLIITWATPPTIIITSPTPPNSSNDTASNPHYRPNTRGIMQRFIANRGRVSRPLTRSTAMDTMSSPPLLTDTPPNSHVAFMEPPIIDADPSPPLALRTAEGRPVRRGFVSVEEKIQKELMEMNNREHELKRMRREIRPFELFLSDADASSEDELPPPGRLKPTKSLSDLYEAMSEEHRSSSRGSSDRGSMGSLKPAKSLAELCELAPGEQFIAPSSSQLIAKWESMIKEKGAGPVKHRSAESD